MWSQMHIFVLSSYPFGIGYELIPSTGVSPTLRYCRILHLNQKFETVLAQ